MPLQPSPLDLSTLASVKSWLRINSADDDDLLQRLLTATSIAVQRYLNRTIASLAYTETVDGTGGRALMLGNYPVTAVASVTIDGQPVPPRLPGGQLGYTFDQDSIALGGSCFTRGQQNVVIQYTAGFAETPFDLEQAVIELVVLRYKERERVGLVSQAAAGETTSYLTKAMPDDVKAILAQYVRVTPATGR